MTGVRAWWRSPPLAGAGGAEDMDVNHGGELDTFDLSAHYYLTAESYGPIPVDWDYYHSHVVNTVMGPAATTERIYEAAGEGGSSSCRSSGLGGQTQTGSAVRRTVDLESAAYMVRLITRTDEQMDAAVDYVRRTVQWNDRSKGSPDSSNGPGWRPPWSPTASPRNWRQRENYTSSTYPMRGSARTE